MKQIDGSVGGNLGMGSQKGGSAGIGQDSGNAKSLTTAGISGMAGDAAKRTGDAQQGIAPIFDKDAVRADVQAQVQITQTFGSQAGKAVGDYAQQQQEKAAALKAQANLTDDPDKRSALEQEANSIESNWKEGGAMRVALHTLVGGLTGGAGGALGAAVAATAAPGLDALQAKLTQDLQDAGLSPATSENLTSLVGAATAAGLGAAAGNTAGAATALNADVNNRQLHEDEKLRIKNLAKGDSQKEARLTAAACALVACYAEFPQSSEAYKTLKALADIGNSAEFKDERALLKQQKGQFEYGQVAQAWDATKQFDGTYQIGTRALGATQAGLGVTGLYGTSLVAAPACATGIGCVAVGTVGTMALDAIVTGGAQAINGTTETTFTNKALHSLGLSSEAANYAEMALGLGTAVGVNQVLMAPIRAEAATNAWARGTYTGTIAEKRLLWGTWKEYPKAKEPLQNPIF